MVFDPEEGSRLALEVAYSLARARVLMARGDAEGLDAAALRAEVERALGAMEDVRRIKLHLTNAAGGIEEARRVLDGMAERVRAHLAQIDTLVAAADVEEDCGDFRGLVAALQALAPALDGGDELREVDLERVEDLVGVVLGAEADLPLARPCVLDDVLRRALGLRVTSCWETAAPGARAPP